MKFSEIGLERGGAGQTIKSQPSRGYSEEYMKKPSLNRLGF